ERKSDPRASRTCVDAVEVHLLRRNVRVQKGDAEKCACGANGGECNATRTEPAAECSFEPNSEAVSSLSATVRRNKNEERKLYHRGCERDANFFLQESNGNAHSIQTRAAYSSEASRADPELLFRRHESRGAAAFPRNYCLPVNSRIFRQPTRGVSELESYREAVSRRNGVELWFHSGKQKC
ncbi:hypothetical protein ALC56_06442, partial [Trachymyrmex septentrionalis]